LMIGILKSRELRRRREPGWRIEADPRPPHAHWLCPQGGASQETEDRRTD
jgi:hypothetical protein